MVGVLDSRIADWVCRLEVRWNRGSSDASTADVLRI